MCPRNRNGGKMGGGIGQRFGLLPLRQISLFVRKICPHLESLSFVIVVGTTVRGGGTAVAARTVAAEFLRARNHF